MINWDKDRMYFNPKLTEEFDSFEITDPEDRSIYNQYKIKSATSDELIGENRLEEIEIRYTALMFEDFTLRLLGGENKYLINKYQSDRLQLKYDGYRDDRHRLNQEINNYYKWQHRAGMAGLENIVRTPKEGK